MCCDAFKKLFQDDRMGGASLATVRVISGLVKSLNYNIKPEVTDQIRLNSWIICLYIFINVCLASLGCFKVPLDLY